MTSVLLVDDGQENLYLLQALLTHHGYQVATANDGAQALALARQSPPDLIVTDILMPVMDGFALCRQWKTDARLKHIPLVFYTATYTDPQDEQFALNLGADAFLVKPAEPDDFMACIRAVLAASGAPAAAPNKTPRSEQVLLKEYNQVLVHKLEQKLLQLEASERYNRTLFERSAIGLALCRMDGALLDVNPAYARTLGRSVQETLGLTYWQVTPEHYAPQEAKQLETLASTGRYGPYEKEYLHADGHRVPVRLSGFIVERGGERLIWSNVEDISERKQAEQEIQQLNAELEQRVAERTAQLAAVNHELETFAYSVSHDLKAPLRGIDGYSHLLQETCAAELSEDARLFIGNIRQGAAQMNSLVDDLLAYSRMERRPLHCTALNLADVVQAVLAERAAEIEACGVRMHVKLPPLMVQADLDGMGVVLRNLLENALKFTRAARPAVIDIGGREERSTCILWMQDNGIGFDMRFHARIFDIFQRLQRAEDYPGTGIGLALVNKAMQRMGGRVWAQSAPGQGATFYLELPK